MVALDASRPKTPQSPKSPTSDAQIVIQLRQFLDEWHCRFAASSLGKSWTRQKALKTVLDLLMLNGATFTADEVQQMLEMEEESLVYQIAGGLPEDLRANFDSVASSLTVLVSTAMRIRGAVEQKTVGSCFEEMENDAMAQQVLKRSCVAASTEIAKLNKCTESWVANMEGRLQRLATASNIAEQSQSQLLILQSRLEAFHGSAKSKSSKFLVSLCGASDQVMVQSSFSAWVATTSKLKAEKEIRNKFEAEIATCEQQLMDYKAKNLENIRNTLQRSADAAGVGLLGSVLSAWVQEVADVKAARDAQAAQEALESKLKSTSEAQMAAAKSVMSRMGGDQDSTVISQAISAWLKYMEEVKSEREQEEALKLVEKNMQEMMKKNKGNATSVLDRMNAATDTGLMEHAWSGWVEMLTEAKQQKNVDQALKDAEGRFKNLKLRQGASAKSAMTRVNDQQNALLLTKIVCCWQIEARTTHIEKYYTGKIDNKRKQLQSVRNLFTSFAQQLDEGLSSVDKASARGEEARPGSRSNRLHRTLTKDSGTTSLPSIHKHGHARGVVA